MSRLHPILSVRAIHCLGRVGVKIPPSKQSVRRVLPLLRAGTVPNHGDPRTIREFGKKTLREIEHWLTMPNVMSPPQPPDIGSDVPGGGAV
jgi:hypothetical protein